MGVVLNRHQLKVTAWAECTGSFQEDSPRGLEA